MIVVTYRKVFFWIISAIVGVALGAIAVYGLNPSTDFTGGTLMSVHYEGAAPTEQEITSALGNAGITASMVRTSGNGSYLIRTQVLSDAQRAGLNQLLAMNGTYTASLDRFSEVGPTIGRELRNKAFVALVLVIIAIMLYVAFSFRVVSKPVSSWVYGAIVIVVLLHDVIVPAGAMALLGHFLGAQADALFVVALLTVLGYSVNDTIVVFDRVREKVKENIHRARHDEFPATVGRAINETLGRSINTSLTTVIALVVLFFFGPEATQDFALILIVGVVAGTYSSIALAAPLLVAWERFRAARS